MPFAIDRPNRENHIVFRKLERGGRDISDVLSVLPNGTARSPPNDFITAGIARRPHFRVESLSRCWSGLVRWRVVQAPMRARPTSAAFRRATFAT